MPKKRLPQAFPDAYVAVAADLRVRLGDALAAQAGPPVSAEQVSATDRDLARAWNARDPNVTDEMLMQMAAERYPRHRAALGDDDKARLATAEDLTHTMYPARLKLYTHGQTNWKDQIKEAGRIGRLAQKQPTAGPMGTPAPAPDPEISTGSDGTDPYGY